VIIIFGSNATLDASQKGRFFNGDGSNKGNTSLELHDITLKNGKAESVSNLLDVHPFASISDAENCFFLCNFLCPGDFIYDSTFGTNGAGGVSG
jgi:hypothetical protein